MHLQLRRLPWGASAGVLGIRTANRGRTPTLRALHKGRLDVVRIYSMPLPNREKAKGCLFGMRAGTGRIGLGQFNRRNILE